MTENCIRNLLHQIMTQNLFERLGETNQAHAKEVKIYRERHESKREKGQRDSANL